MRKRTRQLIHQLEDRLALYVDAHSDLTHQTNRLRERVRVLEEGQQWEYVVACWDCVATGRHPSIESAHEQIMAHSLIPTRDDPLHRHTPYMTARIKR